MATKSSFSKTQWLFGNSNGSPNFYVLFQVSEPSTPQGKGETFREEPGSSHADRTLNPELALK